MPRIIRFLSSSGPETVRPVTWFGRVFPALMLWVCLSGTSLQAADPHPLDEVTRQQIRQSAEATVETMTVRIRKNADDRGALSARGDALFFLSRFPEAVRDYDEMVRIEPDLDTSHWRRGIAMFYAGKYRDAAGQFERYHSFDNVDRENGIWRFLCQTRADNLQVARASLLKYEKDDREPFPDVFRLFAGTIKEDEILSRIELSRISLEDRTSRRFYADLYIGLNHAVQNRPAEARKSLREAVLNPWPRTAGFGPAWMWQVGRVHWEQLNAEPAEEKKPAGATTGATTGATSDSKTPANPVRQD